MAAAHGEVLIERVQRVLGVALRDGLLALVMLRGGLRRAGRAETYVEELDVVEQVVVKGKVVAGDDVDAGILLDLPVLQTQALALAEEVVARELVGPIGLIGLLELTVRTHAGEAEH